MLLPVEHFIGMHHAEVFLLLEVCMGTMVSQLLCHHGLEPQYAAGPCFVWGDLPVEHQNTRLSTSNPFPFGPHGMFVC